MRLFMRLASGLLGLSMVLTTPALANDISNSTWSETDSSNNHASPNGWTSGVMLPSQVEPTARAMMGALKRFYNHINGTITSGGTANVQTLTYSVAPTSYVTGDIYRFKIGGGLTNTGATTLNVNSLGALAIQNGGSALSGGELQAGQFVSVMYDGTQFQLLDQVPSIVHGTIGNNNSLWTNNGAKQIALNDRVVVGAAASVGIGNVPESPVTWLDVLFPSNMQNAQLGVLSTRGLNAIVGGSRSSDFGGVTDAIGVNGFGVNDDITNATSGAWGGYFAAERAASSFSVLGVESEVINLGSLQVMTPANNTTFFPGGQNVSFWAGCGGGSGVPTNCSAAYAIVGNTKQFETGIIFQSFALDTGRGIGGGGEAINMYVGQDIVWTNSSGVDAVDMWGDNSGLHIKNSLIITQRPGSSSYGDNFQAASGAGDITYTIGTNSGNNVYFNVTSNSNLTFYTNNTFAAAILNSGVFNSVGGYQKNGVSGVSKTCSAMPTSMTISGGIITAVAGGTCT